ncbi:transcriptional activator NhaR [Aliikangiella marina]|uniref:Transcriptional activator NhaR n=1 Tax=Aliikangiella marina TaxID=1712262 RepID=A0A545THV3_9GAMM|nr:transcriptional activator NhaR [Aliikangiella marina]TQV76792.1 transcriptional activator NhaR [Aliikangiella marina]
MANDLNYKHLHYFWTVANEGSIAKASEKLHITPQTISGQLSALQERVGTELFRKSGRGIEITDTGKLVKTYADEIFSLGKELSEMLRGSPNFGSVEFIVSVASTLPKTIIYKMLAPSLQISEDFSLICRSGPVETNLAELAIHEVDMVLSDTPVNSDLGIKAYNHFLGESHITFFADPSIAAQFRDNFPQSLDSAPVLLPTKQYAIRHKFDRWCEDNNIYPNIKAQFDDNAILKAFGQAGLGVFFMPDVIKEEVCHNFNVEIIGSLLDVKQRYYAITLERKVKHPAAVAICDTAKETFISY